MDHPGVMRLGKCITYICQKMQDAFGRHRSKSIHQLLQVHARQQFHGEKEDVVLRLTVIIDLDRVWMRQPCRRPHFLTKPAQGRIIGAMFRPNQFHGASSFQQQMLGLEDLSHPARADQPFEFELCKPTGLEC